MNNFSSTPKKFWCPICPKCGEALPTNHSKCRCSRRNLFKNQF